MQVRVFMKDRLANLNGKGRRKWLVNIAFFDLCFLHFKNAPLYLLRGLLLLSKFSLSVHAPERFLRGSLHETYHLQLGEVEYHFFQLLHLAVHFLQTPHLLTELFAQKLGLDSHDLKARPELQKQILMFVPIALAEHFHVLNQKLKVTE